MLGPSSIAGNIRMPVSFGSGPGWKSFGAATRNAAVHEIAKVSRKYESAGCRQIKLNFSGDAEGTVMTSRWYRSLIGYARLENEKGGPAFAEPPFVGLSFGRAGKNAARTLRGLF